MEIDKIIQYLKTDIIGLIILGLVSSLIAGFIYDFIKNQYKLTTHKIKKRLFVKHLVKIAEAFGQGSRASYAQFGTTFQQQVLIGDYVIKTIMYVAWILFYLILSSVILIILDQILSWVPVVVFSIIITIHYKNLRQHLEHFKKTFEMAYGEEYFKNERKGQREYWDKLFKKEDE